jgi:hypothetical protein
VGDNSTIQPLALGLQLTMTEDALYVGASLSMITGDAHQGAVLRFPYKEVGPGELLFPCESDTWDSAKCMDCTIGHYGEHCLPCDVCSMHGTCEEGVGGGCLCGPGWG